MDKDFNELKELSELEDNLGSRLHDLPNVIPDKDFEQKLRNRLVSEHSKTLKNRRNRLRGFFIRAGVVAATVILALTGVSLFLPEKEQNAFTPSMLAYAQTISPGNAGVTFGNGIESMRQLHFKVVKDLPSSEKEGMVHKLRNDLKTREQAQQLARKLGFDNSDGITDNNNPHSQQFQVFDNGATLMIWLNQGSWYYDADPKKTSNSRSRFTEKEAQVTALKWLEEHALLPEEKFSVETNKNEDLTEIILYPEIHQAQFSMVGITPHIKVSMLSNGQIMHVSGIWHSIIESQETMLADYSEALDALRRGEGVFEADNFQPFYPGTATVTGFDKAYQLAYALDYTPYLIPVAVFYGEYAPEKGEKVAFKAYVSMLENLNKVNSGNFILDTKLPKAPLTAPGVSERGNAATAAELPALAAYFGIEGGPQEDGTIRSPKGEISPATWDGGWLYRVSTEGQIKDNIVVEDKVIIETAQGIINRIPVLPRQIGTPRIKDNGVDDEKLVIFPLIYNEIPIISINEPGYSSYIAAQFRLNGELLSIYCSRPMKADNQNNGLLSPAEAWQKLLKNEAQIQVTDFFGVLPAHRFSSNEARISEAKLVYVPRYPQLMRNENYDLKYQFKGTAKMDGYEISFEALVDAIK